jgi:cholesterol oxidase
VAEHFDAVVIGSGFGGSVTTYRLAEAGLRVCLLERGKPYPPGSFARSPAAMSRNVWDPSEGLHGLFNMWEFRGLGGIVASGLGGGSLLYSNVLIRKDRSTFVHEEPDGRGSEYWPVSYEDLEPHYERHEQMLRAEPYPFEPDRARRRPGREPFDRTPKTNALHDAAASLGLEWYLPKLAVTFAPDGGEPLPGEPVRDEHENLHGRSRSTCRLCGECNFGCNFGSKYTLDFNYLSFAKLRHGAEIRTRCEVKTLAPRPSGGYVVGYVDHSQAVEGEKRRAPLPQQTLSADRLVLCAGTFGSTYLLLRNRSAFPGLSGRLGTQFCGNGDLLTFVERAHEKVDGKRRGRLMEPGYGPVITSTIRLPDALDGGEGRACYMQDGGYPDTINWLLEATDQPAALWRGARLLWRLGKLWLRLGGSSDVGADVSRFIGTYPLSSTTLPIFSMGRDVPDGTMRLTEDGRLDVDWVKRRSNPTFESVRSTGRGIARVLDGKFKDNPPWYFGRVITVHALGGCPMGRNEREGVVDSHGRVFGHPGLVVADGSVLPGPVGPNPSNTIAALAHRFAEQLIAEA